MIKRTISILALIIPLFIYSQNTETINWITQNSITIENADPDSELIIFKENTPLRFEHAKIYGFGEASHNTKEFFDIKAKFFKHLVKNNGVRTFIMEDCYQAEAGINEWISGGNGDVKTIAENFNIGYWHTKEIVNLIEWMRGYNTGKPIADQIRFYGMDIQSGKKINQEIREFIVKNKITVDDKLLVVADSCANKEIDFTKTESWWQIQIPKLYELKQQILTSNLEPKEDKTIVRSLDYLISYTQYASSFKEKYPTSTQFRDMKMAENVKYIATKESKNGKAFIWAHNEHINKREMYYSGSNILNLGRHLKDYFKDDYYSVGFDFGSGNIKGQVFDKKNGYYWKTYHIEKPFLKTYANILMSVDKDIYFVDLENAYNNESTKFFSKKLKHLLIAAGGYQPKPLYKIMVDKIYTETYDGLIFVKKISVPNYKLD